MPAIAEVRHCPTLAELLEGMADPGATGALPISGVTINSREVQPGSLFLAVAGAQRHGAAFIDMAMERGAAAIAVEPAPEVEPLLRRSDAPVPIVSVPALRRMAGVIAERFYGEPSRSLAVTGVTGTNGKTSVTHFIAQATAVSEPVGLVGTLGCGLYGDLADSGHTTPDPVTLHAHLAAFRDAGCRKAVMEVSSHALDQGRVAGVRFETAVFTNLTHDHLDYHGSMEAYAEAKRTLLGVPGLRHAVVNLDDPYGRLWREQISPGVEWLGYSTAAESRDAALRASDIVAEREGLSFHLHTPWGQGRLKTRLLGRFNVSNLLAALGALVASGISFELALERLSQATTVPGRMERFGGADKPLVVVDYAHTPDALEKVLRALREHCCGRLWCVFGCGGDRDRTKRPLMGRVAEAFADRVVITNDNPRGEDPGAIIEAIKAGMQRPDAAQIIPERGDAIAQTLALAERGDIVLVAGKGHEAYQQIGTHKLPFSDRDEVGRLVGGASHG